MRAPRRRLFLASAPPATAPPTPPITAPWVFLSPGRLSQPASGERASDAIKRVITGLCLSMSGSFKFQVWYSLPLVWSEWCAIGYADSGRHGFEVAGLGQSSEEFTGGR